MGQVQTNDMEKYDVEFQFQESGIWFRLNDIVASDYSEAEEKARKKLKKTTGIDIESFAAQRNEIYFIEFPYVDQVN